MPGDDSERVPQQMRPLYDEIIRRTDAVCAEHLSDEYARLARRMAAALARKRPSPLSSGKIDSWVCGILYALGRANFLFDQSQTPHLRADELCRICGVSPATGSAKAKAIERALKISIFDADWSLPSKLDQHPLAWMIQVNGLIVDARYVPRPIQEEAFRKGFIPYIPDDGPPARA